MKRMSCLEQNQCLLILELSTDNANLSPVIDVNRLSMNLIANRINNIDSSSDVFPTSDFNASTEPDGDQNVAIYLTKRLHLKTSNINTLFLCDSQKSHLQK